MTKQAIAKILFTILTLILAFATYKSVELSISEIKAPGTCPAIGPVPACYIVLVGYSMAFIGSLLLIFRKRFSLVLFLIGLSIPTLLAVVGTIGQLTGLMECPKTEDNTPMCFLSLAMCSACWILWVAGMSLAKVRKS